MLDGGRPLEAQQPRHADRARLADPAEVVAEHVDDHHVLGLVLRARQQLAGEGAVLLAGPAAGAGALDRVGRDLPSPSIDRNGSGDADSSARGRRSRARRRGRDSRRTAPGRRSGGAGTRATGRRRTGPRAGGSGSPGRCRRARWRRAPPRRHAARRRARVSDRKVAGAAPASARDGRPDLAAAERLDPRPHLREPPIAPADVAIDRPCRQPRQRPSGGPRPASSRGGRAAAPAGAGRPGRSTAAARTVAQVVAEEADEAATERRRVAAGRVASGASPLIDRGRRRRRPSARGSTGPRRTGRGRSAAASTTATGSAVRYSSARPTRSGALEQGEARQVAEGLGGVQRARRDPAPGPRQADGRRRCQPGRRQGAARNGPPARWTRGDDMGASADRRRTVGRERARSGARHPHRQPRAGCRTTRSPTSRGVRVGHATLIGATGRWSSGEGPVRTGVTV